ncbi:MAG TPA: glycerol-3-phosphate 1-O-acyltransferase PlsY [Kiritimatiellae bacterium]|nr:glycerol-3-phosphate 1-O-acyltransferase PlsY [Kiritimatiellia bacterium]
MTVRLTAALLISYTLGSIPFAFLVGKLKGVDIRKVGSGNVGATNLVRVAGPLPGLAAFTGDFFKGFLAAFLLPRLLQPDWGSGTPWFGLSCGLAAVAGHSWPIFLRFRGGKGVATSAGMLAAVVPWGLVGGLLTWLILVILTRYVSIASMGAAVVAAATCWVVYPTYGYLFPAVLTALALLVIVKHRSNIRRLFRGQESRIRFGARKKSNAE